MKEYSSPEIEYIEIDAEETILTSGYICPNAYGSVCVGNPYSGS